MAGAIWSETYRVHSYDMDARGAMPIHRICGYLEDAAGSQTYSLRISVPQIRDRNLTWMIARLLVRVREYPVWPQEFTVQTWSSGMHRMYALREWRLLSQGRRIGEAASAWLLLDTERRRPLRPSSLPEWQSMAVGERTMDEVLQKLPAPEEATAAAEEFVVRSTDVDVNGHANHTNYVIWCTESVPAAIGDRRTLAEIELDFRAEASRGDRIVSRASLVREEPPEYLHTVRRSGASGEPAELARARTLWR